MRASDVLAWCLPTAAAVGAALSASGCASLDGFLFAPERVEGYDFDGVDPRLDGELSDPHPSLVGPADRFEGFVTDAEGNRIHWVFARRPGATDTFFYSHGRARHLGRYWDRIERLWSLGYHVLVYDYPGYGRSTGEPSERGLYASAVAAFSVLSTLPDVDPARVWLYGYSLGGAPTFELALRVLTPPPRGLVSEAAFCSVGALVEDGAFLDLPASYVSSFEMDNCAKARALALPVLLLHGTEDDFVVPRHAQRLKESAPAARLELVRGAGHDDIPTVAGESYGGWLAELTSGD